MTAQQIYAKLVKAGLSPIGACALMGNMYAESALRSNNAQDGMTKLTDAEYTAQTDKGSYKAFITDSVGYGLCQWTYAPRKRNLLSFAQSRGVSIGDANMQVDFCLWELGNEYLPLLKYLQTATNLYEATGRVCKEYERPAVNNISVRAAFANEYYCQFGGCDVGDMENTLPPTPENTTAVVEKKKKEYRCSLSLPLLRKGCRGGSVKSLQRLLRGLGFSTGSTGVDGIFGPATEGALRRFQHSRNLPDTGIADWCDWAALLDG